MLKTKRADLSKLRDDDVRRLYDLMLHAYAVTEIEIWGENYSRMSESEFQSIIERGELILAELDGEIVGSIHVYPLTENTYAFGLLSADFDKKGLGIGRALISAAESEAKEMGAEKMSLEILRPRDFDVPLKTVLRDWYIRLGYAFTETLLFEERKPDKAEKAKRLKVPTVFDCYEKALN